MSHDWGLGVSPSKPPEESADTPELRAKQAESWAAQRIEELNQRLAKQIDSKFNTGSVIADMVKTVALACIGFAVVALAWSVWVSLYG